MINKFTKLGFWTALIVISFGFSAFDVTAQTSKRRRRVKKPSAAAVAAPPLATQNPNYVDGNQIVLGEIPPTFPAADSNATTNDLPSNPVLPDDKDTEIKQLGNRLRTLEAATGKDARQKRLLMNLDILTRAESRAESLRKQLFEIIEKENVTEARIQQISIESSSDVIDRNIALMGSLRPEELRDRRRKSLESEKNNLTALLVQIQTNHAVLDSSVQKADALVEKIRGKLDKEIDDSLADDNQN